MSALSTRPLRGWLVPAAAALAVIAGGVAIGAVTAAVDQAPPPRSAGELLIDLQSARLDGLSGTVVARSNLGIEALPPLGADGEANLASLITGNHTVRIWYSGPDKARVAVLGSLGETDVIANGREVWIWDSRANTASHRTLPARDSAAGRPGAPVPVPSGLPSALPTSMAITPQLLASLALAALEPSTIVTTNDSASVAGRDAHELVLAPRDPASLVGSVRLAIDAVEHLPLRVQIFARGEGEPAFEIAFTQISFARPDPQQFVFNPPPGAKVVEQQPDPAKPDSAKPDPATPDSAKPDAGKPDRAGSGHAVIGTGWTSVFVVRAPQPPAGSELTTYLEKLPAASGAWGSGRILTTKLVSVLITDDGRILIGAVRPQALYAAAADPAAKLPG